jgi:hypothetical protein
MLVALVLAAAGLAPVSASAAAPSCATTARSLVTRWVDAYNKGDARRLDRIFAPAGAFVWYSSSPPGVRAKAEAMDRSTLVAYFAARHAAGDRIRLRRFHYNSTDRRRGLGHFEMTLRRRARDFRGGRWFTIDAKGAVSCARRQIVVTSLGGAS